MQIKNSFLKHNCFLFCLIAFFIGSNALSAQNTDKSNGLISKTSARRPAEITQNEITYTLDWSNKTAAVKKASENIKTAIIPAEIKCKGNNFKVTEIGEDAFYGCSTLTSVTIPNSVTVIGKGAFSFCYNLTSVKIPDSVTEIGTWAFQGCRNLTSVTIPASVEEIGKWAFIYCDNLTAINVDSRNRFFCSIDGVLYSKDKTEIIAYPAGKKGAFTIPNGVKEIRWWAFWGCNNLTSVTIPNSVTKIVDGAFKNCENLTSVNIPNSITEIGESAFEGCLNLTSVKIPDSVTKIGAWAFDRCFNLTSVTIPSNVTEIGTSAFSNCDNLAAINVDSRNRFFCSIDGVLYSKDKTEIIAYPAGKKGAFTIPLGVTEIRVRAFEGCLNLTSVTIPDSVTEIGAWAFEGCRNLKSVTIPDSVKIIGGHVFYGCSNLDVTYPANAEIGYGAFDGCRSATPRY